MIHVRKYERACFKTEAIVLYSLKIFNQHIQIFHLAFLYLKTCQSQWELNDF